MTAAREGSVILTVQIKHDSTLNAAQAFNVIEQAIRGSQNTRVATILKIRQEKVIEYVRIGSNAPSVAGGMDQMLIIVVVVVVLVAVLFVSGVTVWKVSNLRRARNAESPPVKSYDNPAL